MAENVMEIRYCEEPKCKPDATMLVDGETWVLVEYTFNREDHATSETWMVFSDYVKMNRPYPVMLVKLDITNMVASSNVSWGLLRDILEDAGVMRVIDDPELGRIYSVKRMPENCEGLAWERVEG